MVNTLMMVRFRRLTAACGMVLLMGALASLAGPQSPLSAFNLLGVAHAQAVAPIGPNDNLDIAVVGQADLSKTYTVDADGDIDMAYVGKIHLGGLTPDAAGRLITQKLNAIYTNPQVTVTRSATGGIGVTVTGAVTKQGNVAVRRDSHLNDLVQQAGPTEDADLTHIKLTHGLPGQEHTTLNYDLTAFLNSGDLTANPALQDGDTIFIPHKAQATISVSIIGEVKNPGRKDLPPGSTVYDLLTMAGGLTTDADPTTAYIQPINSTSQLAINLTTISQTPQNQQVDPVLKDGDKIVVPQSASIPQYSITGAVLRSGQYPLKGQTSLLDAIGIAGGLQKYAKAKQATITRTSNTGAITQLKVDASDTKTAAGVYLQPGDNVVVPEGNAPSQVNPFEVIGLILTLVAVLHH